MGNYGNKIRERLSRNDGKNWGKSTVWPTGKAGGCFPFPCFSVPCLLPRTMSSTYEYISPPPPINALVSSLVTSAEWTTALEWLGEPPPGLT